MDGALLPPEDVARIGQVYLGLIKKLEEYLVAHPASSPKSYHKHRRGDGAREIRVIPEAAKGKS